MWSTFFISTLLAINLPTLYGDVSHIVNNKHPGYGHHKPDKPLEYPGKGTHIQESQAGYPKVVPDNQLQIPSTSISNIQTQYPVGDSITAGANSGGFITNLQTHTDSGGHQHHHHHGEDGKYNPHDDGTGWDIRKSVPGEPEQDYPTYATVPRTTFTCADKVPGYYADKEARCQAFRICTTRSTNSFTSFLCPNGTIFNQAQLTCDWWNNVNCEHSEQYYYKNNEIGQMPEGAHLMYMVNKMLQAPVEKPYNYNGGKIHDSQEQGSGEVQQGIYLPPVVHTTQQPLTTTIKPYQFEQNIFQNVATKPVTNQFTQQQQQQQSFNNNNYAQTTTQQPIHSVLQTGSSSGGYQQQNAISSHSTVQTDSSVGGYQYQQPSGYIPPAVPNTSQQTHLTLEEIQYAEQQEHQRKQQEAQRIAIQKAQEAQLYQQNLQNIQRPVPQQNDNDQLQHSLQKHIQQSVQQEQQQKQHNVQENVISNYSPARPEYNQIDYGYNKVGETTSSSFTSSPPEITTIPTLARETTPLTPFVPALSPDVSNSFDSTDTSDNQGTLFLSTLAPSTVTPEEEVTHQLHVSPVVDTGNAQPLFVSDIKPQLFTSQVGNHLFISNAISKEENNTSPFVSQLTTIINPQPLFVSPIASSGSSSDTNDNSMLFTSPITPTAPNQTLYESTIVSHSNFSQVQPAVTFTKENTQTVTHSQKTTHTIHGTQNPDLEKGGPEKISLVDNAVQKPAVPQQQNIPSYQNTQSSTSFQTNGYQQVPEIPKQQTIQAIQQKPVILQTQQHIPSYQNTESSTSFEKDVYHNVPDIPKQQTIQEVQQNIPSYPSTQSSTSFQKDGYPQIPEISKEQAIQAINQLTSPQQPVFSTQDNSKFGHGLIDIRGKDENLKSVDFPNFSQDSFQTFQGYQFPSETPSFHFDNFHHINSHLKSNNQRVNYEFSNDKTANNYQGQGVTNFGKYGEFGAGTSHHSYTGQNLGFKQTTKVEIVPAIGFEISDPVGRNNFQSALQNGLFKDSGFQNYASQSQFHPSDARYSSYHGPSSYLVPQMSVQQLPSDSEVRY